MDYCRIRTENLRILVLALLKNRLMCKNVAHRKFFRPKKWNRSVTIDGEIEK